MPILIGKETHAIVQGVTGSQGSYHTQLMLQYGSKIVAGVTPGKGGTIAQGIPVFDTIEEAQKRFKVDASIIFVPAPFAKDAALEAIAADLNPVVIITEGIPVKDEIQLMEIAKRKDTTIIGPNTPGIITPTDCKLGIMPGHIFKPGKIGLVSRSGTLTYEIAASLTNAGLGQSTCLGIGGDPVVGLTFVDVLEMFREDPQTSAIAMIGEIGGNAEEKAAEYIMNTKYPKPVAAYIAGRAAPPGKRMGHAGAIIMGKSGTAETKIVKELGESFGKRVKLISFGGDDRGFLEDLFSPLSILAINTVWIPDGSTETKVILTGRRPRNMPVNLEMVQQIAKDMKHMTLRIEFDRE